MRLLPILLVLALTSCTLKIKGVCESGPNKGQSLTAAATWNGMTGSGKITAVAPWGEKAEGRYQTMLNGASVKGWDEEMTRTRDGYSMDGGDVVFRANGSTQVGTALMFGDQGTTFNVVYWASAWSPNHGQGRVKDSRGNKYRILW